MKLKKKIAFVPGDGSAPEMMEEAWKIAVKAATFDDIELEREIIPMGWEAYDQHKDTLPKSSLDRTKEIGILFFGGVGDTEFDDTIGKENPKMKPEGRCLLTLREEMGLLLNFRPFTYYHNLRHLTKLRPDLIPEEGVSQTFIRFLLEDTYFGNKWAIENHESSARTMGVKLKEEVTGQEDIVVDVGYYTRQTLLHYFRAAFQEARNRGLPVISLDKANVMPRYVFWRKILTEVHREFPDVTLTHKYVDAGNALLFTPTELHGVVVCGNEHGDLVSDGAAGAFGGMGLMCSSAINPVTGAAMFESGAGTAPTLKGQNVANPIGRILTAAMMLRYIGAINGARAIEWAVENVLLTGYRTRDIFSPSHDTPDACVGTKEMGDLIMKRLKMAA